MVQAMFSPRSGFAKSDAGIRRRLQQGDPAAMASCGTAAGWPSSRLAGAGSPCCSLRGPHWSRVTLLQSAESRLEQGHPAAI